MESSAYCMDLYCENKLYNESVWNKSAYEHDTGFPHQYAGHTRGQCVRQARKDGWIFNRDRTHTCPDCSGKNT